MKIKSWNEISKKVVWIQGDEVEGPRLLYQEVRKVRRTPQRRKEENWVSVVF